MRRVKIVVSIELHEHGTHREVRGVGVQYVVLVWVGEDENGRRDESAP